MLATVLAICMVAAPVPAKRAALDISVKEKFWHGVVTSNTVTLTFK